MLTRSHGTGQRLRSATGLCGQLYRFGIWGVLRAEFEVVRSVLGDTTACTARVCDGPASAYRKCVSYSTLLPMHISPKSHTARSHRLLGLSALHRVHAWSWRRRLADLQAAAAARRKSAAKRRRPPSLALLL